MNTDISHVRRNIMILVTVAIVAGFLILIIASPIVSNLSPEAAWKERLNYVLFTPLLLTGLTVSIYFYLRPIAQLATALRTGQDIPPDVAQRARTLAFTIPIFFLYILAVATFVVATASDIFGVLFLENYSFAQHYPNTILITITAACISLIVSVISRRTLAPVLLITSGIAEDIGPRFDIRNRQLVTTLLLTLITIAFLGLLGYNQVMQSVREGLREKYSLLGETMAHDLAAHLNNDVLVAYVEALSVGDEGYAFIIDGQGNVVTQIPPGYQYLQVDSEVLIQQDQSGVLGLSKGLIEIPNGELVLIPLDRPNVDWWLGFAYRVAPLSIPLVQRTLLILLLFVASMSIFVFITSRYVADDLTRDVKYVTARLSDLAQGQEVGKKVSVLSLDEVGDLVLAFNQLQVKVQRRAVQLRMAAEVARHTTGILDVETLLTQTVELICKQFDLYYTGIFLVDETGQWAVLRAGIGEGGRQMLETGHRLKVGGHSMIGWCTAHGEARLDLDVSKETVRLDAPLLPRTHSEMALPLVSRGLVIGAMTIQSVRPADFSQEDVTVFQTVGDQLANAIENARLFENVRDQARELASLAGNLTQEKSKLDAILRNIADGLIVTDPEGIILLVNPAFAELFGRPATALVGRSLAQEVTEEEFQHLIADALRHQESTFMADIPLPGGRTLKASSAAISEDERTIGVVTVLRDITHEVEVDRMKTEFISTVSHELRTPLTSVLGFAKLIRRTFRRAIEPVLPEDERTRKAARRVGDNLAIIVAEGERLTRLINDVLDIAKMEAGKIKWRDQSLDLPALIHQAVEGVQGLAAEKGLPVRTQIEATLSSPVADHDRILQVLTNLLSNGIKFTEHGEVVVSARNQVSPKNLVSGVVVSVADTGVGISEEEMSRLFQRFQQVGDTLRDKPKGTGLGLAICREIVTHYGGTIWAESTPGQGSTFSLVLPLSPSEEAGVAVAPAPDRPTTQSPDYPATRLPDQATLILIADDEPHIRELLSQTLGETGYRTLTVATGTDAVAQARRHHPDLILLDLMMPGISGLDVLQILKSDPATLDIPILVVSIVEKRQQALALGADGYLPKPVDIARLLASVSTLLARHHGG